MGAQKHVQIFDWSVIKKISTTRLQGDHKYFVRLILLVDWLGGCCQ